MVGFAVIVAAIVVAGTWALGVLWRRFDADREISTLELIAGGALTGSGAWIAANWVLALTHSLTRPAVMILSLSFIAAATVVVIRLRHRLANRHVSRDAAVSLAFLVPLVLWIVFVLWRGTVTPPLSHDALAYHLPKAVLMMRAQGYERFVAPDVRIGGLPANYELLVADVMILSGNDKLTEWIGTTAFVLLLVVVAAITRRWGCGVAGTVATVIATASAPVVLLHSGADKNDLLTTFFALGAILFGSRWCVSGGRTPAALAIAAAVLGVGTKPNAAAVAAGLLPFALWRLWILLRARRLQLGGAIMTLAFIPFAVVLGGGWSYISSWLGSRLQGASGAAAAVPALATAAYGDWFNLWQFPYLLLTIPFAASEHGVWVPWAGEYWFWPHYEIFWSHYGFLFTIAVLLLPFAILRLNVLSGDRATERRIAMLAAVIAVAIMLPTVARPIGFYGSYPRYVLVLLPLIFARTFGALADALWRNRAATSHALLAFLALAFCWYAALCAEKDRFAPLEYVIWASRHPGTRSIPFMGGRAASVVDRRAGPHDEIAIEGTFETWSYPAYGAGLTRTVTFLPPNPTPADVPTTADWVIIDRSWNTIWAMDMKDMGEGWTKLGRGRPGPGELQFFEAMLSDPRFRLVYRLDRHNQAVFKRVAR